MISYVSFISPFSYININYLEPLMKIRYALFLLSPTGNVQNNLFEALSLLSELIWLYSPVIGLKNVNSNKVHNVFYFETFYLHNCIVF